MAQYIDKSALVTEIERRRKQIPKDETDKTLKTVYGNEAFVLTELLSFIDTLDTLETKEVDLEEAVEMSYLQNWYQDSIDETKEPIWTDKHLEELYEDFYLIPKAK